MADHLTAVRKGWPHGREIAELTKQKVSTVRGHLRQMRRKKLVTKFRGRWYRLDADPVGWLTPRPR